jgi:hypothetical protein
MTISEETLMAFADGELDETARAAVELAMREDPEVSRRVARHRALRERLQAGFAGELSEPVPERLMAVLRDIPAAPTSNVVDLQNARAAMARAAQARAAKVGTGEDGPRARTSWGAAASIAAGVLLGVGIGYGLWRQSSLPIGRGAAGTLIANGSLAGALSHQLTAEQASTGAVRIGVSYLAKSGEYCRSFTLAGAAPASGIACRHGEQWQIHALAQEAAAQGGAYRTAAAALSPVILKMIEDQIQGEPLDSAGESTARRHEWQSPK